MAKKNQRFTLDEFGMDSSLDMPNFSAHVPEVKDDRKPITKVPKAVLKGMGDRARDPAFIEGVIKKSLPKGYGEGKALADEAAGTVRQLYDTAAQELKPAIRDARKLTKRILPGVEDKLPRNIAKKVKEWAEKDDSFSSAQQMQADMRESQIASTMGQIFAMQTQQGQQESREKEVKDQLDETLRHKRHLDQMGQLDSIRMSLAQMANYQSKIDSAWQRKSLELQFRHYFVAADTFEEIKRASVIAKQNFEIIAKNTGLPEFVKIKSSERLKEITRTAMMENILGLRGGFMGKLRDVMTKKIQSQFRGLADAARMGISGVEFGLDAHAAEQEMAQAFGGKAETMTEKGAKMVGGGLLSMTANKGAKWVHDKYLSKNDKVARLGNKIGAVSANPAQWAREFAMSDKGEGVPFMRFLKESILQATGIDTKTTTDKAGTMTQPDIFNRMTNKSITEVIPGFLSRILRELQWARTGEQPQMVVYDYNAQKFTDHSEAMKRVFSSIVKATDKSGVKSEIDTMWKELGIEDQLTPEERKAVGAMLLKDNMNGRAPHLDKYTDAKNFSGDARQHAQKVAAVLSKLKDGDKRGEKYAKFAEHMSRLGSYVSDARGAIQTQINLGNKDELERLGMLHEGSDFINMNRLYDYYTQDPQAPAQPQAPAPSRRAMNNLAMMQQFQQGTRQQQQQPQPTGKKGRGKKTSGGGMFQDDCTCAEEIIKAIKESSRMTGIKQANETLLRIEKQLAAGIPLVGSDGKNVADMLRDGFGKMTDHFKGMGEHLAGMRSGMSGLMDRSLVMGRDFMVRGKRIWDRSLGDNLGSLWDTGVKGVKGAWGMANTAADRAMSVGKWGFGKAKDLAKGGWTLGGNTVQKAREHMDRIKPVYVPGIDEPVLNVAKLKAGHYRDKVSGKIITRFEEIAGAVIDADTNQEVLTSEQAQVAYVKGVRATGKRSVLKGFQLGKDGLTKLVKQLPPAYRFAAKMVDKGIDFFYQRAQDVYVRGEMQTPKLLGSIMKAGGYFSRISGKVIVHPGQIDGPIVDDQGQVKLTQEDIAKGLVNSKGQEIKTGWKLLGNQVKKGLDMARRLALDVAKRTMATSKKVWGWTKDLGKGIIGGVKRAFKLGNWNSAEEALQGQTLQVQESLLERTTQILELLKDRLPGGKKVFGDTDGDGIRDGSLQDILRKQAAKAAGDGEAAAGADAPKGPGRIRSMLAAMTGKTADAANKVKDKTKDASNSGMGLMELMEAGGALAAAKAYGKRLLGGAWKLGKGAVQLAGRGLWGLGKGALRLGSRGLGGAALKIGGTGVLADAARMGLRGASSLMHGTGQVMEVAPGVFQRVTSGASQGARGLWAGRGALWNSAKSGAGELASQGWNAAREATPGLLSSARSGLGTLRSGATQFLRAAPGQVSRAVGEVGVGTLRDGALNFIRTAPGATLNALNGGLPNAARGAAQTAMQAGATGLKGFGANALKYGKSLISLPALAESALGGALGYGADWLGGKLGVGQNVNVNEKLDDVNWNNMSMLEKLESGMARGTEKAAGLFFLDNFAKEARAKRIANESKYLQAKLKEKTMHHAGQPETRQAMHGLSAMYEAQGLQDANGRPIDPSKKTPTDASQKPPTNLSEVGKAVPDNVRRATAAEGDKVTVTATVPAAPVSAKGLDTLATVRYKAYGLKELDAEKVTALRALESQMAEGVSYKDGVASWKGSPVEVYLAVSAAFGDHNQNNWQMWFRRRFLPVYLNYVSVVAQQTGKENAASVDSLTGPQAYAVAQAIVATRGVAMHMGATVWEEAYTPWQGYELSDSKDVVQGNLQALQDDAKKSGKGVMADPTARRGVGSSDNKPKPGSLGDGNSEASREAMGIAKPESGGFMSTLKDKISQVWEGVKDTAAKYWDIAKGGNGSGGSTTAAPGSGGVGFGGGGDVGLAQGAGGAMAQLPIPKGEGKWEYFQELYQAVGKMVGIDPALMGAMTAQESGFHSSAKAPTSSATGLFQFISGTWKAMLKKYGPQYGIPPDCPSTDPRANAILGACYIRENLEGLKGVVSGRGLTATDAYMAHFLGLGGARTFLKANPDTVGAQILPDAARQNASIFWKDKDRKSPRTLGEIYQVMRGFLANKAKQFGVPYTDGGGPVVSTPQPAAPADGKPAADGQKSTTAPGTDAKAGTPSIPVSNQQAGATSAAPVGVGSARGNMGPAMPTTGPNPDGTGSAAGAQAAGTSTDSATQAMGSGFQPASVAAQQQFQKESGASAFGPVNDILKETLGVNKSQLEVLGAIRDILLKNAGASQQAAAPQSAPAAPAPAAQQGPAQGMPELPVSMRKGAFV